MMKTTVDRWLILRTSARNTLKLAQELAGMGLDSWAPRETFVKRKPRKKEMYIVAAPLLPGFVFSRAEHLHSLLGLAGRSINHRTRFSIFRHLDGFPLVDGDALSHLRIIEDDSRKSAEREINNNFRRGPLLKPGDVVRIGTGAYAGMDGVVERNGGRFVTVCFNEKHKVKISAFILAGEGIGCLTGPTAKAA